MGRIPQFNQQRIASAGNLPSSVTTSTIGSQASVRRSIESPSKFELGTKLASQVVGTVTGVFEQRQQVLDKAKKAKAMGDFALMAEKKFNDFKINNQRNLTPESEKEFADSLDEIKGGLSGQFVTESGKAGFALASQNAINRTKMSQRRWARAQGIDNATEDLKGLATTASEMAKSSGQSNDAIALGDAKLLVTESEDAYSSVVGEETGKRTVKEILKGLDASFLSGKTSNIENEDTLLGAKGKYEEAKSAIEQSGLDDNIKKGLRREADSLFNSVAGQISRSNKMKLKDPWGWSIAQGLLNPKDVPEINGSKDSHLKMQKFIADFQKAHGVKLDYYPPEKIRSIAAAMEEGSPEEINGIISTQFSQMPPDEQLAMSNSIKDKRPYMASAITTSEDSAMSTRIIQGGKAIKNWTQVLPKWNLKAVSDKSSALLTEALSAVDVDSRVNIQNAFNALIASHMLETGQSDISLIDISELQTIADRLIPTVTYEKIKTASFKIDNDDGGQDIVNESDFKGSAKGLVDIYDADLPAFLEITGGGVPRYADKNPVEASDFRDAKFKSVGDGVYTLWVNGFPLKNRDGVTNYTLNYKESWEKIKSEIESVNNEDKRKKRQAKRKAAEFRKKEISKKDDSFTPSAIRKKSAAKSVGFVSDAIQGAEDTVKTVRDFFK